MEKTKIVKGTRYAWPPALALRAKTGTAVFPRPKVVASAAVVFCLGLLLVPLRLAAVTSEGSPLGPWKGSGSPSESLPKPSSSASQGSPYLDLPASWDKSFVAPAVNEKLAHALEQVTGAAGKLAVNVKENVGIYVQSKYMKMKQTEILNKFYEAFEFHLASYALSFGEDSQLLRRVEDIYIEEGTNLQYGLDMLHFRDMPQVIKKAHADMKRESAVDGLVETYYMTGELEGQWSYRQGKLDGYVFSYDKDGRILYIDHYREGFKLSRKKYDAEGRLEFTQDYPNPFSGE